MDVKEYISSGILEAYVLGGLSDKERQEVECMSSIYEEIGIDLKRLQDGFEEVAKKNAVDPPVGLKLNIMQAIAKEEQENFGSKSNEKTKIVPLQPSSVKNNWMKIAAVALILISSGLIYLLVNKNQELTSTNKQLSSVESNVGQLKEKFAAIEDKWSDQVALNDLLKNSETQKIEMSGTELDSTSNTRVFLNEELNQIALKVDYLPEASSGKQYQLWAIVDGKPTDMGVLDIAANNDTFLIDFTEESPQAFAITLEVAGGQPTPDLSSLYVIGEV